MAVIVICPYPLQFPVAGDILMYGHPLAAGGTGIKNMIIFDSVSKFILSNITLHVPQGKTLGLTGVSGAGKTTFLKLAYGLLAPEEGEVYVRGAKPLGRGIGNRGVGVLFADKPFFDKGDTVRGNFEMIGSMYRLPKDVFHRRYEELAQRLGFAAFERETAANLSLGQRRRAELGAVLIPEPEILLLDEPAVGLDENAKLEFRSLLEERKERQNMTVVLSSHDMTEIAGLCDRIALLRQGKLLFHGGMDVLRRSFLPWEELVIKLSDMIPDLEDLPLERYSYDGKELRMVYRADYITRAEILSFILRRCCVTEVSINRPGLEELMTGRRGGYF